MGCTARLVQTGGSMVMELGSSLGTLGLGTAHVPVVRPRSARLVALWGCRGRVASPPEWDGQYPTSPGPSTRSARISVADPFPFRVVD